MDWLNAVAAEEMETMGPLKEAHIHANYMHTQVTHIDPLKNNDRPKTETRALNEDAEEDSVLGSDHDGSLLNITEIEEPSQALKDFLALKKWSAVTRDISALSTRPLIKRASESDLEKACKVVKDTLEEAAKLNIERYEIPLRHRYALEPGTVVGASKSQNIGISSADSTVPALLGIADNITEAAALVFQAESMGNHTTCAVTVAASGSY
jgi:hypothetical protein